MIDKFDTIIIGAGAAGLMCAYNLGLKNKKVLLLDHSQKLAEKIRISGGGRCNFTNIHAKPECYLSDNPYYCISALSRYTPLHFCELLNKYNIKYHEKTLGQLFCNNSSTEIIDLLDHLCNSRNVNRKMGVIIQHIEKSPAGFILNTNLGKLFSETVVIATGGLALPQVGATGFGYEVAKQFGIPLITPSPALVPLALDPNEIANFNELSGISFFSSAKVKKISFLESTLLTHRGLSGPAILQISSYWAPGEMINIDMLPDKNLVTLFEEDRTSNKLLSNYLTNFFSSRLAENLCKILGFNKQICQLTNKELTKVSQLIHNLTLKPTGTLGYKKAEVTKGGVNTKKLSSKTMSSIDIEGLYFIGEVVDVTGWLGGYNFQWAWASAYACSDSI